MKTNRTISNPMIWLLKPRIVVRHTFFVFILISCLLYEACSRQDEAERIRLLIARGAASAEAHDIAALMDLTSDDVLAMPMSLDRRDMKGVLWRTFAYYGPMHILYPRPLVDIGADAAEATVELPFLIVRKERTIPDLDRFRDDPMAWIDAIGETADLYRLRLRFIKRGGDWLVNRVILERFTGMGFK